ncbi:MAG: hypothetical protein R3A79_11810 [Nannocystaceae bacterium]
MAHARLAPRIALGLSLTGAACVIDGLSADLEGPRVVQSSLAAPRTIEHPVAAPLIVEFSEPLDPASLTPSSVVVAAWEEVGSCELTPSCAEGSCERGRCQVDPLRESDLRAIDRGDFAAQIGLRWSLTDGAAGPGTRLEITPEVAYAPRWRHSLVLGAHLRDRSGAPLLDDAGARGRFRRDFVTTAAGASGPEAALEVPTIGELVPRNLATVTTTFVRPVSDALDGATLELIGDDGSAAALVEPAPCPGWVPGFCLVWRVDRRLAAGVVYRVGGGSLVDRRGRSARPPHELQWFVAGDEDDRDAPQLELVAIELRGRCVVAEGAAAEAMTLRLRVGAAEAVASGPPSEGTLAAGVALRRWPTSGSPLRVLLELEDRAGNRAAEERLIALPASEPPPLAIVEILANPAGPEPAQEFVELLDVREEGAARTVEGLRIVDAAWPEVAAAIAEGELPGAAIPAFTSEPGRRAVIVGDDFRRGDPSDPDPPPDAALVVLDRAIGSGGLGNSGEPLTIYDPQAGALVAAYGSPRKSHVQGRSVVNVDPGACDIAGAWRAHPLGASSPGWSP